MYARNRSNGYHAGLPYREHHDAKVPELAKLAVIHAGVLFSNLPKFARRVKMVEIILISWQAAQK
jgi:hypothetical protein